MGASTAVPIATNITRQTVKDRISSQLVSYIHSLGGQGCSPAHVIHSGSTDGSAVEAPSLISSCSASQTSYH